MKLTSELTRKLGEVILCLGIAGSLLQAQEAEATLATARFHVVQDGRYVPGVKPEDVILLEDGAPRKFTIFENGEGSTTAKPVEVTLVFDTSGGVMDMDLLDPLMLKEAFLDALPGVKLAVYGFSKTLNRYTLPTSGVAPLTAAVNTLRAGGAGEQVGPRLTGGTTAALVAVLKEAASTPGQASRMVVVFSEALEKSANASGAAGLSNELGIAVYPVVLGHADLLQRLGIARRNLQTAIQTEQMNQVGPLPQANSKKNSTQAPRVSDELKAARNRANKLEDLETEAKGLKRLGDATGGRAYDPTAMDPGVMKTIWGAIALETSTQYAVGFPVGTSLKPKNHKVEIRLVDPQKGTVRGGQLSVRY